MPPASRTMLLLVLLSTPALPQAAPLKVFGMVRDEATGAPVADAEVRSSSPSIGNIQATTDAQGQFTLDGLAPGEAKIHVFHFFLGGDITKVVNLREGPDQKPIEILLRTGGHISGHVTDQEGKPLAGISVRALRRVYSKGQLQYAYAGGDDSTRSDGQYYIDGLPAGRGYIIQAQRSRDADVKPVAEDPEDPALRKDIPAPTYYPNADAPERAIPVLVESNDTLDHVDIRLLRSPSYCVQGAVDFRSLGIAANEAVSFNLGDRPPSVGRTGGTLGPDGKFRICELYPGDYSFSLSIQRGRAAAEASSITVIDRDVDRVTPKPLDRSVTLTGSVDWVGETPILPEEKRFIAIQLGGPGLGFPPQRIPLTGEFSLDPALPWAPQFLDSGTITVSALPPGAYVKSIQHVNHNLAITLAAGGARITAQAADKDGNPVPETYIAIFPASPESPSALSASLRSGKTDSRGVWTSEFLPPGKYSVLATGTPMETSLQSVFLDNIAFETIEKLWLARGQAQTIDLSPGANVAVTLLPAPLH